jgi:phage baseplate assembly protein W
VITSLSDITSADWSLKLDPPGGMLGAALGQVVQGIDDVAQCIAIICTTPKGTDPLRPTFAIDLLSFIDQPMTTAIPDLVRAFADAITTWERRVILLSVGAVPDLIGSQAGAQLIVTVVWRLNIASSKPQKTTVTIPWAGG